MMSFPSLDLPEHLLKAIKAAGFTTPTPVQRRTLPLVGEGRDVAIEAQTGSGKTAAFVLPILKKLGKMRLPSSPSVLTLVPTRELALQVAATFTELGQFSPVPAAVLAVIGGESIDAQMHTLEAGVQIVVATPGRLLDLLEREAIDLSQTSTLVLDEADKLLRVGFLDELEAVLACLPHHRQTLLFSATLPPAVVKLANHVLREPTTLRLNEGAPTVEGIAQRVFQVDRNQRRLLLQSLLREEEWGQTLIFVATQRATENLSSKLRSQGFSAVALHGGLDQAQRVNALERFKRGEASLLIATDIAARGIDITRLSTVVNFDLPRAAEDYLHRIGRSGRAGRTGRAVSFIDHDSEAHFRLIERRCKVTVPRQQHPSFPRSGEAPEPSKGVGGIKGKRKSKKDKLREAAAAAIKASPES